MLAVNQGAKLNNLLHPSISKRAGPGCPSYFDLDDCLYRNCPSRCSICCGSICYCDPDCNGDRNLYCNCDRDNCLERCPIAGACDVYDYNGCADRNTGHCNDYFRDYGYGCCNSVAANAVVDCPLNCRNCCPIAGDDDTNRAANANVNFNVRPARAVQVLHPRIIVYPPRTVELIPTGNFSLVHLHPPLELATLYNITAGAGAGATFAPYPACLLAAILVAYTGRK
ncbi:unnamed protein product [Adineta steineri]|uniref:Uncharacterized protein n=1 Tax=Adineta steineri TaxID=433720 RepID=A0A814C209_9BILA|nr:unnamed protein product [Adineta steineri]CAF0970598.1 unnamed protein product [Adineta steineri]